MIIAVCPAVAGAQALLKARFEPGVTLKRTQVVKVIENDRAIFLPLAWTFEQTTVSTEKHGPADSEGNVAIEIKTDRLDAKLSFDGGTLEFQSADRDKKAADPDLEALCEIFRQQLDSVLKFSVDKANQVGPIEGVLTGTDWNPLQLQKHQQQVLERFPGEAVKPGDTWQRTEIVIVADTEVVTVTRRYEYVGAVPLSADAADGKQVEKVTYTDLEVTVPLEGEAKDPQKATKLSLMPETKSGGTLLLDNERGIVVSEESELHVAYSAKTDKQIKSKITVE